MEEVLTSSSPLHFSPYLRRHQERKTATPGPYLSKSTPRGRRPPLLTDAHLDLVTPPITSSPSSSHPCATATATSPNLLKHYAALASKLAGSGKLEEFLTITESVFAADAFAAEPSQFLSRLKAGSVAKGVAEVLKGGGLAEVLEFFRGAQKLGVHVPALLDGAALGVLAAGCRRILDEGRVEEFVHVMETLSGYKFHLRDIADPNHVLKIFVENRDPIMAIKYASLHSHSQLLFCSIIRKFGKKKDLASALKAYENFKEKIGGFNMFACRGIIDVCGICGDPLGSRYIFEDLLSRKITLNTHVFNSLMNVNAHDLNYTLYVYRHMQNLGVLPDTASYNILLKACCCAKRVDLAQDIYKETKLMESTRAIKLDVITYSTMIKAFADAKMPHMALIIKEDMTLAGVTPNVVTWSSLIGAWANTGHVDLAEQSFQEMLLAGCKPNSWCCNNLLYACVRSHQYDKAFRLFSSWKHAGFKLLDSTKKGSLKIVPFKPTVATYNIMMKACGSNHHHAKLLLDEMETVGLSPNHISRSILIDICGNTRDMRGAMQAFKTMRDVGIRPDVIAYTAAIKACINSKSVSTAFSLFEEMKRYQVKPNMVTFNTLLGARRRYGSLYEVQQWLALYQDMRKSGYRYSSNDNFLKELLEEWCEEVTWSGTGKPDAWDFEGSWNKNGTNTCQNRLLEKIAAHLQNDKAYKNEPESLLLEKVAAHLQKDVGQNRAIDLRGLTKAEARIVILSVLKMIKDNHGSGLPVKDDMIIITGVGRASPAEANHELEVQNAIISVLRGELGIDVLIGPGSIPIKDDLVAATCSSDELPPPNNDYSVMPSQKSSLARRPEDLGLLRITTSSIYNWLQKRTRH